MIQRILLLNLNCNQNYFFKLKFVYLSVAMDRKIPLLWRTLDNYFFAEMHLLLNLTCGIIILLKCVYFCCCYGPETSSLHVANT